MLVDELERQRSRASKDVNEIKERVEVESTDLSTQY